MTDEDGRVFTLAVRHYASLDHIAEVFDAHLRGAGSLAERAEIELGRQLAIERHVAREQAEAEALEAELAPRPPRPEPEPLPDDATDEEHAARFYGARLTAAPAIVERTPLKVGESRHTVEDAEDVARARELYGGPMPLGGGVTNPNTRRDPYPATPGEPV